MHTLPSTAEALPTVRNLAQSPEEAKQIEAAILLVLAAFHGKYRYPEDEQRAPMAIHSLAVGVLLQSLGYGTAIVVAGFCHDLIEDTAGDPTPITYRTIWEIFGTDVADTTYACTLNAAVYEADAMRGNQERFARIKAHGSPAIIVELADILHNLRTYNQIPVTWRDELRWCATEAYKLGVLMLGANEELVRLIAAQMRVLNITVPE